MLRRITYRTAANAFIFTGLWFLIGAMLLWSPVPGALGIRGEMFGAWVLLFFVMLAGAGSALTLAAINGAFPTTGGAARARGPQRAQSPQPAPRRRNETLWAPAKPAEQASERRDR